MIDHAGRVESRGDEVDGGLGMFVGWLAAAEGNLRRSAPSDVAAEATVSQPVAVRRQDNLPLPPGSVTGFGSGGICIHIGDDLVG